MKTSVLFFVRKVTGKISWLKGKIRAKAGNFSFSKLVWNYPLLLLGVFWTFYFLLDLMITTLVLDFTIDDFGIPVFHWLGGFLIIAVHIGLVMPLFFKEKRRILALNILAISAAGFILLKFALTEGFEAIDRISSTFIIYECLRLFQYLFVTGLYWKMIQDQEVQKQNLKLKFEMEILELERRAMKMSPHFFLNTLTVSIHEATRAIPEFWDIYGDLLKLIRYSFKDYKASNSLQNEISAVVSFFKCQSKRFEKMAVDFQCSVPREIAQALPFPKLCLLTAIENLFFYGIYEDPESPALVSIDLNTDNPKVPFLSFRISNQIDSSKAEQGNGFGLNALKNIMKSQFGKNFEMKIEEKDLHYSLQMTVCYANSTYPEDRTC